MNFDKKTVFSLFIVFLFIGSLFAMMAYGDRPSENNTEYQPIEQETNFVNYTATFDANVGEIFSQLLIAGKPIDYEEATINNKLLDVSGIKNKKIEFTDNGNGEINVILTLNISLEKKEQIIEEIRELEIIENIEIYQYGLLEVPQTITFTNDQNQEITYDFVKPNMEGILGIETLKGDLLTVVSYATFRGSELVYSRGIEQVNKDNQMQLVMGFEKYEILEFQDKIETTTTYLFEEKINTEEIETKILEKYPNSTVSFKTVDKLVIGFENKEIEEYEEQLKELNEEGNFLEYGIEEENIFFSFKEDVSLEEYAKTKELLKELFECDDECVIDDLKTEVSISLKYYEIDTQEIKNILNKEELEFSVLSMVDTSNVVIAETSFEYEETQTPVYLSYPDDLEKTEIELNAQGWYQRNKLLYLGLSK